MNSAPTAALQWPSQAEVAALSPGQMRRAIATSAHAPTELIETHISWVILCGAFAYKIKKPVRFEFLDFSTLELRYLACVEEVRLNSRFTTDLYLDVVPIRASADGATLEGHGAVLEWAVRMRRFDAHLQLDRQLAAGALTAGAVEQFGARYADLQDGMPLAPVDAAWGQALEVHAAVRRNLAELRTLAAAEIRGRIDALRRWSDSEFRSQRALLEARRSGGFIREGHGDLHLANLTQWKGEITPFDALEFDPALRWIDVVADIAFLVMDLERHRRADLAHAFLDGWLERSGDWEGTRLLRYYVVHRALVRAKVAMIRSRGARGAARAAATRDAGAYLKLAHSKIAPSSVGLILMHGLSASGKSTLSRSLCTTLPALRVRSDIERKRLHGLHACQSSHSDVGSGLYGQDATAATYRTLLHVADTILATGSTAVVDAAFLQRQWRDAFIELGRRRGVAVLILDCRAPIAVLRQRLVRRAATGGPSEADARVLEWQLRAQETLQPAERARTLSIDMTRARDPVRFAQYVRRRLRQCPVSTPGPRKTGLIDIDPGQSARTFGAPR